MIKHEGDKYVVYSESGKRFGSYSSEKDAKRRLAQMEMFKHMKKTAQETKYKFGTKMVVRDGVVRKEWGAVPYTVSKPASDSLNIKMYQEQLAKKPQGMSKKGSAPKLKNFFSAEPSCVVHGAGKQCVYGKSPNFAKKAQFEITPEGAKHINQLTTNHLVKSYAKHQGKGVLREFKNQEIIEPIRKLSKLPTAAGQASIKKGLKEMAAQALKTLKSLR